MNELTVQDRKFLSQEKIELIKRLYCKEASNIELQHFLEVCESKQLDPTMKQIYAVFRWSTKDKRYHMSIQTGIDGFRAIADRTGAYAGSDKPVFGYLGNDMDHPSSASVTVYKMVQGQRCAFTAEALWTEYFPSDEKSQFFWKKMPHGQLGKCAESLALRKAFPHQLSGIYSTEEMHQAGETKPQHTPVPVDYRTTEVTQAVIDTSKTHERVEAPPQFESERETLGRETIKGGYFKGKTLKEIGDTQLAEYEAHLKQKLSEADFPMDLRKDANETLLLIQNYLQAPNFK